MADAPDRMLMLDALGALALRAGLEIMTVHARGFKVVEKADHSPLTEADMASHRVIAAGLAEAFPDIPVISEEGADVEPEVRRSLGPLLPGGPPGRHQGIRQGQRRVLRVHRLP